MTSEQTTVRVGDVIQLDPEHSPWGPMLCIVEEVHPWGVSCYWLGATARDRPPAYFPYRATTGTFARIGLAEWFFTQRPAS